MSTNKVERFGVFETNSSSTHSIGIMVGDFAADTIPCVDGACTIYPGEFGWEVATFHDAATKASYCLTYAKTNQLAECETMLREVLEQELGCAVNFESSGGDYYEWGYIDHQSDHGDGDACGPAFASKENLRSFIFNPQSYLHTDNDNH